MLRSPPACPCGRSDSGSPRSRRGLGHLSRSAATRRPRSRCFRARPCWRECPCRPVDGQAVDVPDDRRLHGPVGTGREIGLTSGDARHRDDRRGGARLQIGHGGAYQAHSVPSGRPRRRPPVLPAVWIARALTLSHDDVDATERLGAGWSPTPRVRRASATSSEVPMTLPTATDSASFVALTSSDVRAQNATDCTLGRRTPRPSPGRCPGCLR